VRTARATILAPNAALLALGAAVTLLAAMEAARGGALLSLGPLLGLLVFLILLAGYVTAPHRAVAFTIPYFILLPMLKTLVTPTVAPTKDIMIGAATLATGIAVVQRKRIRGNTPVDHGVVVAALLWMGLYFVNIGAGISGVGRFGLGWFHGVRLVWEPLLLMLFGLTVRDPRRTLRWAMVSLIAACFGTALYGLAQQGLGPSWLVAHGYSYGAQVRTTFGGRLRSFGTLDETFDYATVLAFGLAGVVLWARRGLVMTWAGTVIAAGLAVSFVRGAAISVVALLALVLARKGHTSTAVFLLGAVAVSAVAFLLAATRPTPGHVVQAAPSVYLTLNGRTRSWREALGKPKNWAFGRGVGIYGTAAARAARPAVSLSSASKANSATDSGYLATLSDVGLVGLALVLTLFGRILVLFRRAIARGDQRGWFGIGLLTVMLLDAALRSSFTGFPTADIVFLLVGLTVAATMGRSGPSRAAEPPATA
jgi:O-antigen ligase